MEYIAMEYVPGGTLESTMSEDGFYPEEDITRDWLLDYFLPVLDSAQALHASKIVHRDLKPGNILMDGKIPKITEGTMMHKERHTSSSAQQEPSKLPVSVGNFKPNTYGIRELDGNVNEWYIRFQLYSSKKKGGSQYFMMPSAIPRQPWEGFEDLGFRTALSIPKQGR